MAGQIQQDCLAQASEIVVGIQQSFNQQSMSLISDKLLDWLRGSKWPMEIIKFKTPALCQLN
jgi:hypothetical protein